MMDFKDKLYSYLSVGIIIACCCTLIIGWIPIFARTWIWTLVLVVLSLSLYKEGLAKKYIFPLLFYGFILYLNVYVGDPRFDWMSSTMELSSFLAASHLFYIFSQESFNRTLSVCLFLYIVVMIITLFGTFFAYKENPDTLRIIQEGVNGGNMTLFNAYAKLGVESYEMGHGLPCLIPIVIHVIKNSTKLLTKSFCLLLLFSIISLVYMATATTSLLISIILILISFLCNENRYRNIFVVVFCTCIALFFMNNRELLGRMLDNVIFESGSTYERKIADFQDYATYGEAGEQTEGRFGLYRQSWEVFCAYPLLGSDDAVNIGGHSIIIDRLAMLGLLGIIPFAIYLYKYMRYVLSLLSKYTRLYCLLGFIPFIVTAFLKNIFSFEYIIITLFIMPLGCLYIDRLLFFDDDTDTDDDL